MKTFAVLALAASISYVLAENIIIKDVKVVTPDGKEYERIEKKEIKDGQVVRETIEIKGGMRENRRFEEPSAEAKQLANRRHHLQCMFIRHFKMAQMLHSLLNNMPVDELPEEEPKHHPVHKVFVIRLPLTGLSIPLPVRHHGNHTTHIIKHKAPATEEVLVKDETSAKEAKQDNPTDASATPAPPTEDQIPPPFTTNML